MTEPTLHLAVALDGTGWHPASWREPGRPARRAVHRRLLGRPGAGGRARPAGLRHDRGRARPAVRRPVPDRTTRTDQVRGRLDAVLIAARVAPLTAHIGLRADGGRHAHRAVPHLQGDRHAGLREHRPGRRPGPGLRPARRGRAVRPAHDPAGPAGRAATAPLRRAVRRGRRLRRGRAPALGQLGGRRRDPGRRHRPVRRPGQAALHRLRGRAVLASRARRSRRGRRRASRSSAALGPPDRRRTGCVARSADVGFVTPRDAGDAAAILAEIRAEQAAAGRADDPVHVFADLRGVPRRRRRRPPRTARPASTSWPAPSSPATRASSPAPRPSWPTCCRSGTRPG